MDFSKYSKWSIASVISSGSYVLLTSLVLLSTVITVPTNFVAILFILLFFILPIISLCIGFYTLYINNKFNKSGSWMAIVAISISLLFVLLIPIVLITPMQGI